MPPCKSSAIPSSPHSRDPGGATPDIIRRRFRVAGRVQGVGYRIGCARVAERLGVAGWVRNCDDGEVEVVAIGPAAAVNRLLEWCRSGPRGAVVYDVAVTEEAPDGIDVTRQRFRIEG